MEFIQAKTIVSSVKFDGWFGVNFNMNIYRGCCHGCIYCDSRSECYRVDDFDTVRAKADSLKMIEDELRRKKVKGIVGTGSMSDPYNPFERKYELTRGALKLIDRYGFGLVITTKSAMITRDIDILSSIKRHSPVLAQITITATDDELDRIIEPHVSKSSERFDALNKLSESGINCGILLMPLLPFINDTEENVVSIIRRAAECGARYIYPSFGVTLRTNQRDYFYERLEESFPGLKQRYIKTYGNDYSCKSPNRDHLWRVFTQECDRFGIVYNMQDIIKLSRKGYGIEQISLFD